MDSSEQHRNSINAQLSGLFGHGMTEGTVTGGTFSFTEPEMRAIIKNWMDLAHSYWDSVERMPTG